MDRSDRVSGGLDVAVNGENCLKQIANNYSEEEDGDSSSGEEADVGRENGTGFAVQIGHGRGGKHVLVGNGAEAFRDNARDGASCGDVIEVSAETSDEEHSGESSENGEEEDGDDEDDGDDGDGDEEEEGEDGEEGVRNDGPSGRGSRESGNAENGFANAGIREHGKVVNNVRFSGAVEGMRVENGVEVAEKSVTESEGGPESGPSLRKKRGRPLKSRERFGADTRGGPITPKLEEPRAVRINRGVKRRFPGDESEDDSLPKRIRVRSIASVCGDFLQTVKGEDLSMDDTLEATPGKKRGRPRKSEGGQSVVKSDEGEFPALASSGKRKVEGGVNLDSLKRPCHAKNGPIFACNAEGCKKRFVEAAALYAHARVHGDRPYVCHYDGCIKSFSERSKLKRHFLIHTGEKPFLCVYEGCGKAFSLDFNLRSHMKTHTGDYHECPYDGCDKRYCQEYKLRAHVAKEHSKPVRIKKKLVQLVDKEVPVTNGSNAGDSAAAKKREMLAAVARKRSKLVSRKEGRLSRMKELEEEKQREASELARIEQGLRNLERERRRLEEGHGGSPGISLSDSGEEDADEEEDGEEGEEEVEAEGEASPSNGTGADTSCSDEQQSRLLNSPLEYTAMGEGKDVVMFAHKLPTADQGARLVKTMEARGGESQQEPTTSLTPLLWLQGPPPHHGHLAQHSALRPFLRSRRPAVPEVAKASGASGLSPSVGEKENSAQQKRMNGEAWSQGESSDSFVGKPNGGGKVGSEGGSGKWRASSVKKSVATACRSTGKASANVMTIQDLFEKREPDQKPQKLENKERAKASKQQSGRLCGSEPVFVSMNPVLLSGDHGLSPTDARFLANEGFPSLAQGLLRDRLQVKEPVRIVAGPAFPPKEKVYRSMNEVLHSSSDHGFSACSGLNEGFGGEQGPSEQSFEPSAAQLFTYHEQPRLVD